MSNALLALALAAVAWVVTRLCRHPKVVLVVWLLVLAKLLAAPMVDIPWPGWHVAPIVGRLANESVRPARRPDPAGSAATVAATPAAATSAASQASDRRAVAAAATSSLPARSAMPPPVVGLIRV